MVNVLGLDIGGANTKAAFVTTDNGKMQDLLVEVEYFPIWKEPQKLTSLLLTLKQQLNTSNIDAVGVTMTAELSDAYQTKREGVNKILEAVTETFPKIPVQVLNTETTLVPIEVAKKEPLMVAAANWAATGWLVGQIVENCVVIDIGSTSTSIIPVLGRQVSAIGKTDLEKLALGELVYSGSLRTNVVSIVHSIPIRNILTTVASELFALTGDVHLVLGNIEAKDYTCETADGRGISKPEALARLARVVCADREILSDQEIIAIAHYIYDKQILQVAEGLTKVYSRYKSLNLPAVVTGLGKNFIARKAAEKIGINHIIDLGTIVQPSAALATPAVGVALITAGGIDGRTVKWIPQ